MKTVSRVEIFLLCILLLIAGSCNQPFGAFLENRALLSFSFTAAANDALNADVTGAIGDDTVSLTVPTGTTVTDLKPTFTFVGQEVRVGMAVQISGVTPQDFTLPVEYSVVSWDGGITEYTVTVGEGSSAVKAITGFSFVSPPATGVINESQKTITITVPYGTDVTNLVPTLTINGSQVNPASGVAQDFTSPVTYTVTAEDGSTVEYTVTVNLSDPIIPTEPWAKGMMSGLNFSAFNDIAVDEEGNVYAVGYQSGNDTFTYDIDVTATADVLGGSNSVIVKYSADGTALWARTVTGGEDISEFNAIALDSDGSVYAAGFQRGSGTYVYDTDITAVGFYTGGKNAVLVKYDEEGTAMWARSVTGGVTDSEFKDVVVDGDGNIFVVGYQTDAAPYIYDDTLFTTADGESIYKNPVLVKYDDAGNAVWAFTTFAGTEVNSDSLFEVVTVDDVGTVYAAGNQYMPGSYPGSVFYSASESCPGVENMNNGMLVAYDGSNGDVYWATSVGQTEYEGRSFFYGLSEADGYLYAAGYIMNESAYWSPFDFGNGVTVTCAFDTSEDIQDGIMYATLVQYDISGLAQWVSFPSNHPAGSSSFQDVAVDSRGNVYAAGYQMGTESFTHGGGASVSGVLDNENALLVCYGTGAASVDALSISAVSPGTDSRTQFSSITTDSADNILAAGTLEKDGYSFTYETFSTGVSASGVYSSGVANFHPNIALVKYGPMP